MLIPAFFLKFFAVRRKLLGFDAAYDHDDFAFFNLLNGFFTRYPSFLYCMVIQ